MWGARLGLVQGWWCAQWSAWARWAEGPVSVQDNTGVWTLTSDSAPVSDCGAQDLVPALGPGPARSVRSHSVGHRVMKV